MSPDDLEGLSRRLGASLERRPVREGVAEVDPISFRRTLLRLLARGRPAAREEMAALARLSATELDAALEQRNVEYDAAGRIVAAGLSLEPVRHRISLGPRTLYTWCALDALMYVPLLGETFAVSSPCAATGRPVTMRVTAHGVEALAPLAAGISVVERGCGTNVRDAFCRHINFFSSAAAAADWLAGRADGVFLPVSQALELGHRVRAYCS